jgi:phosphoribosylamine--glycine ligase
MNVLIIGSGGREHALAWKLSQSPRVEKIFAAPGNPGTAEVGENAAIAAADIDGLVAFARSNAIGLSVIGPDDALAAGIVDAFEANGLKAFGPKRTAAQLESSKVFAKEFMRRHGIPTAGSREFTSSMEAHEYARSAKYPLVIKADGLALGKGVIIAENPSEAAHAIYRTMDARAFGDAGTKVVIEEFLIGTECSIHALVDGSHYVLFPDCRDHKQACDGNIGPNTGGMGTVSPSGRVDADLMLRIREEVMDRFMAGLAADGIDFRGMLFPGLMLTADGPKVLEFNCRWGDPETQVLVRRLNSDLLDVLESCANGTLADLPELDWSADTAICVVMASAGYPGVYEKGFPIEGLPATPNPDGVVVFHAGTALKNGQVVTNGGRVLGVTATGATIDAARETVYAAVGKIHFDNSRCRTDIGIAP